MAAEQRIIPPLMDTTLYFAYPGKLDTATGGYHYDRRLIQELRGLGVTVHALSLGPQFPAPTPHTLQGAERALAGIPDGATVIVDGLALGVLDDLAAKESSRLRLIALCHHPLAFESGLDDTQRKKFMASERRALQQVAAVLVTSPYTARLLATEFAVSEARITIAVPGTDPVEFAAGNGNPVRLLTVGSLTRRKGHDVLIDALSMLPTLPWTARFVGSDEFDPIWTEQLKSQVQKLRLDDRILFTGKVPDPQQEYLHADVFVLPSRFEGYGMVFSEALAAGLPVIAARAGAVPDVVPEAAGRLVPPNDSVALSDALRTIISDQQLRLALQAGARAAATSLPTWADSAQIVAALIQEVQQQ